MSLSTDEIVRLLKLEGKISDKDIEELEIKKNEIIASVASTIHSCLCEKTHVNLIEPSIFEDNLEEFLSIEADPNVCHYYGEGDNGPIHKRYIKAAEILVDKFKIYPQETPDLCKAIHIVNDIGGIKVFESIMHDIFNEI